MMANSWCRAKPFRTSAPVTSTTLSAARYQRHQPADLAALSAKLLKFGQNTKEEPDLRFVYLREARDLAARAADPNQSLSIIAEMSKTFAIEGEELAMKIAVLDTAGKAVRNLADPAAIVQVSKTIAEEALKLLKETEAIDDYEQAMKLAAIADRATRKTGDASLSGLATRSLRRVERLQKEYAKHVDAAVTLAARPNDPEASRVMGSFRCFHKGDWAKGLPLLARCDDAKLKDLAAKDLAAPSRPTRKSSSATAGGNSAGRKKVPPAGNFSSGRVTGISVPSSARRNPFKSAWKN